MADPDAPVEEAGSGQWDALRPNLLRRIRLGDAGAFEELVQRFWGPLVSYADRVLHSRDDAEDAVQDALIAFWNRRRSWKRGEDVRAFLYRSVRNRSISEYRRRKVRYRREDEVRRLSRRPEPSDRLVHDEELRELIGAALESLPQRRREIFVLARYHGHSHKEIGAILGISPQTVANQMVSALQQLREHLGPHLTISGTTADGLVDD